jgi:hypothetical protein
MKKLIFALLCLAKFNACAQVLNHSYIQDNRFISLSPKVEDRWGRIKNFELNKNTLPWETPYLVESTTLFPPIWVYDKVGLSHKKECRSYTARRTSGCQ